MRDREIDVVLLGATGFTGKLAAEYLAGAADPKTVRIALAGRNPDKLSAVREAMLAIDPSWSAVETIRVFSDDALGLERMARRAKVVATTVGPYAKHGEPLVRACAEAGTDYVDLTGEPVWWRAMIDRYHDVAKRNDATIVPCCGFDSVPHDLGALFTVRELGGGPAHVRAYVSARGTFSGGTWASALDIASQLGALRRAGAGALYAKLHRNEALGRWGLPMPSIDPLVVHRSARLCEEFGEGFRYEHYLAIKTLPRVLSVAAAAGAVIGLAQFERLRPLLQRLRPAGDGPSEEERSKGKFRVTFVATSPDREIRTEVTGHDPGYGHTSKMIAEAALCLALDRSKLPLTGGILTPAAALGSPYLERLERTGMTFRVVD